MDSENKPRFDIPLFIPQEDIYAAEKTKQVAEDLKILEFARLLIADWPKVELALRKISKFKVALFIYYLFWTAVRQEGGERAAGLRQLCDALEVAIARIKPEHDQGWEDPNDRPSVVLPAFLELLRGKPAAKAAPKPPVV